MTDAEHAASLDELGHLGDALGLEVIARFTQKRDALSKATVIGEGKLRELARVTGGTGVVPSGAPPRKGRKFEARDEPPDVKGSEAWAPGEHETREPETREDEAGEDEGSEHETRANEARAHEGRKHHPDDGDEEGSTGPRLKATYVLVDHDLTPSQARNLERASGAEVLDRSAVILAIFHRRARTREARLEVEIARLKYMAPRLREAGGGGDRQRGGIGGRGAGESAMELDRRKVRDRIAELRRELEGIEKTSRIRGLRRSGEATVALVGYTNAGKSSLMRGLTGNEAYVADKLFATLDTTVRALHPEGKPRVLVSDTVGFIKKLPHDLVASFRATLDAALDAQLLIHVVDGADPSSLAQWKVTREVVESIGAGSTPSVLVVNKVDRMTSDLRSECARSFPDAVFMSARHPSDVADLRRRILAFFESEMRDEALFVPYAQQSVVAEIHREALVISEEYTEDGTALMVRAPERVLSRFRTAIEDRSK